MCAYRSSLAFFQGSACDTQLFSAVGNPPQNQRNTDTNASAMVHFLLMLIFSVGKLLHNVTVQLLDTAPCASN